MRLAVRATLLWLPGAGKTTSLSIMMGEIASTKGKALLCGHDIARDRALAYSNLGCCFQFDALFDLLTGTACAPPANTSLDDYRFAVSVVVDVSGCDVCCAVCGRWIESGTCS